MKRKKDNKNDKLIVFMVCFFAFAFLSWIISGSTYQSGKLVDVGMYRAGLYDLVAVSSQISCRQNGSITKKELVLVFDDFERSKIDKIELLGVINDYCENDGIKTILVADEEHIDGDEYRAFKEKLISRTVKIRADYVDTR